MIFRLITLSSLVLALIGLTDCSLAESKELVLFSSVGINPFDDYTFTISPNSSEVNVVFKPNNKGSILSVSATSYHKTWALIRHELTEKNMVEDHIYLYYADNGVFTRLSSLIKIQGTESEAFVSPDDSRLLISLVDDSNDFQYNLWLVNLKDNTAKVLVKGEKDVWYKDVSWNPKSQEIVFMKFQRLPQGLDIKLMKLDLSSGEIVTVIDEPVAGVCYSPDGKRLAIWSKEGLEVLDTSTGNHLTIFDIKPILGEYEFHAGGIIWSPYSNKIAFSLFNLKKNEYELWTINDNGGSAKMIFSQSAQKGNIIVDSFINYEG
jgi:Tol biopolymer transport system component